MMKILPLQLQLTLTTTLIIKQGDLTQEPVDVIVNAANQHLQHGGGIAWAIVRRGGASIQKESDAWVHQHGLVNHQKPAVTGAGKMPCHYVFHAVGPVWGSGDEENKLHAAIYGCLQEAAERKLTSIAFPAISTGIFGFPKELAASIFFTTFQQFFTNFPENTIRDVRLVLFDQPTIQAFLTSLSKSPYAGNEL
jgi:O-acetyl-ADP-ribose deacetylase